MEFVRYLRARNWPVVTGYLLFIGMMAIGYFYNVTFVQLGLKDLGERVLALPSGSVAGYMALLALLTCAVALVVGFGLQRWAPVPLLRKLQLAVGVVLVQTVLTATAPVIRTQTSFLVWIVVCSLALGTGVPVTFGLSTDLIPVRDRGYAAATITALAYFLAAVFSHTWRIDAFSHLMLLILIPGVIGMTLIVLLATWDRTFVAQYVAELGHNHRRKRFARGRFLSQNDDDRRLNRRFLGFVALMFGIFFVDSLGFLRIIDTPLLVSGAWQAPTMMPRLVIGVTHVLAALVAGILYTHLNERHLFYWVFGIFALTHFGYSMRVWLLPETTGVSLSSPVLYATAVSLYTVLNFALWADFSTPRTITRNTAIGVALSGWTATFISTALAIRWQHGGMSLTEHLRIVNALAFLFFLAMLLLAVWPQKPAGLASGDAGMPVE